MIRSIETSPPNMADKVMDEEKVDEEGNGFIQSFMLQQRQNGHRPPESRFVFHSFLTIKKDDDAAQERLWH